VSGTEDVKDREGGGMREAIVISYDLDHLEFRETREILDNFLLIEK